MAKDKVPCSQSDYRALKMSEARLRTIVSSEPECVKTVDRECNLLDMNPAGLQMISANSIDEVLGVSLFKIIDPAYHALYKEGVEAVFRGETRRLQFEIVGLDGTRRWVDQTAAPLFDPEDPSRVSEMVAVTRDISRQKEYEAQLIAAKRLAEMANQSKTKFLTTMSHEIRTPLNGILGMAQILQLDGASQKTEERARIIESSGHQLLDLLNDILDVAKIESGLLDINEQEFSPLDVMREAADLWADNSREKGLDFEADLSPGLETRLLSDPVRVRQIADNFLSNAVKFTTGGQIRFSASLAHLDSRHGELTITVTDTGAGIPPEEIETVFEEFFQSNHTITQAIGGTGLGLAICRKLAVLLGGEVELQSELGVGTAITATIRMQFAAREPDHKVA